MLNGWDLEEPLDAIIFDCDGTLSHIEGIDVLAKENGVYEVVSSITESSMSGFGLTPRIYEDRLNLVKPTLSQVEALAVHYQNAVVPDAKEVIKIFQKLGKSVFVVSAGVRQAIGPFCKQLGIKNDNIYAVSLDFDEKGQYKGFDVDSPLVRPDGKCQIIEEIKQKYPSVAMVGDGVSDSCVLNLVNRFIGYGGMKVFRRVLDVSLFYINVPTFLPLLPLCIGEEETEFLNLQENELYQKGIDIIFNGNVIIK